MLKMIKEMKEEILYYALCEYEENHRSMNSEEEQNIIVEMINEMERKLLKGGFDYRLP